MLGRHVCPSLLSGSEGSRDDYVDGPREGKENHKKASRAGVKGKGGVRLDPITAKLPIPVTRGGEKKQRDSYPQDQRRRKGLQSRSNETLWDPNRFCREAVGEGKETKKT